MSRMLKGLSVSSQKPSEATVFSGLRLRTVLQRCKNAQVCISGESRGVLAGGFVALVGFASSSASPADSHLVESLLASPEKARRAALAPLFRRWWEKVSALRVFSDSDGKMNESLLQQDSSYGMYLVSQFTLFADTRKGNRPSYSAALSAPAARHCFEDLLDFVKSVALERPVFSGVFAADMEVTLTNDGPVTLVFDCTAEDGVVSV
jgi:D-tyrosyl-tRNA(Tyr) deacylase